VRDPGGKLIAIGIDHNIIVVRASGHEFQIPHALKKDRGFDRIVNRASILDNSSVFKRRIRQRYCVKEAFKLARRDSPKILTSIIDPVVT
jgi:hypothetical protein